MGVIRLVAKLAGVLAFAVMAIGAFLLSLVVGAITFMVMVGTGIIALVTFGIIDYRKSKKPAPPSPVDEL